MTAAQGRPGHTKIRPSCSSARVGAHAVRQAALAGVLAEIGHVGAGAGGSRRSSRGSRSGSRSLRPCLWTAAPGGGRSGPPARTPGRRLGADQDDRVAGEAGGQRCVRPSVRATRRAGTSGRGGRRRGAGRATARRRGGACRRSRNPGPFTLAGVLWWICVAGVGAACTACSPGMGSVTLAPPGAATCLRPDGLFGRCGGRGQRDGRLPAHGAARNAAQGTPWLPIARRQARRAMPATSPSGML